MRGLLQEFEAMILLILGMTRTIVFFVIILLTLAFSKHASEKLLIVLPFDVDSHIQVQKLFDVIHE